MNPRELFKEAAAKLRDNTPAELHPDLKRLERAYHDLHQINGTLKRKLEEVEATVSALQSHAQQAKIASEQEVQQAASLRQKLSGKEQEIKRLQNALQQVEMALIDQQKQGYNAPMIADFLEHLEADLRAAVLETEHPGANGRDRYKLDRFAKKYGHFGCFTPNIQNATDDSQSLAVRRKVKELQEQRAAAYEAELNHLLALRERLSIALEACKRRGQILVRRFTFQPDGTVSETKDIWMEPEKFRRVAHASTRHTELRQSESELQEQRELDAEEPGNDLLALQKLPESDTATSPPSSEIDWDAPDEDTFIRWATQFEEGRGR